LHVEGYAIYNKPLTIKAMQLAKANNALISLSLGSFELVRAFRETLIKMLTTYVDIVFANEEEAKEMLGGKGTAEEALEYMASLCTVAVVTLGKNGCVVMSGDDKIQCPVEPVPDSKVVDTTGAGDLFAR
jgi:sugar/nucleoside kinase (ribokinase family)